MTTWLYSRVQQPTVCDLVAMFGVSAGAAIELARASPGYLTKMDRLGDLSGVLPGSNFAARQAGAVLCATGPCPAQRSREVLRLAVLVHICSSILAAVAASFVSSGAQACHPGESARCETIGRSSCLCG